MNRLFRNIFLIFNLSLICPLPQARLTKKNILSFLTYSISLMFCSLHVIEAYNSLIWCHFQPKAIANLSIMLVASFNRMLLSIKMESLKKIHCDLSTRNKVCTGRRKYWCLVAWLTCTSALNVLILVVQVGGFYAETGGKPFVFLNEISHQDLMIVAYNISLVFFLILPLHVFTVFYSAVCLQVRNMLKEFKILLRRYNDPADCFALNQEYRDIAAKVLYADNQLDIFVFTYILFDGIVVYLTVTTFLLPSLYDDVTERCTVAILNFNTFLCGLFMMMSSVGLRDDCLEMSKEAAHMQNKRDSEIAVKLPFPSSIEKGMNMSMWGMGRVTWSLFVLFLGTVFMYCILLDGIWNVMVRDSPVDDEMGSNPSMCARSYGANGNL